MDAHKLCDFLGSHFLVIAVLGKEVRGVPLGATGSK